MFVKFNRTNKNGDTLEAIVDASDIAYVAEEDHRSVSLYDEDGNEIEKKDKPVVYKVWLKSSCVGIYVDKANFDLIVSALTK